MEDLLFAIAPSAMDKQTFVATFGAVYEHSPWIAEQAYAQGLQSSHNSVAGLSQCLANILAASTKAQQLHLINAHPDLAGKAAVEGTLTAESTDEQKSAGIDRCTPEEFARFQAYNQQYKEKFAFPFIKAVKNSHRHEILAAFEERIHNDRETEFQQALREINKIAQFRLSAIAEQALPK